MTAIQAIALNTSARPRAADPDVIYVVDSALRLIQTNAAWDHFARANGGADASTSRRSVLDAFSGAARARWEGIYAKLLGGEIPNHFEQFSCPSPATRRTYLLRISPRRDEASRVVALVHRTTLLEQTPARGHDRTAGPTLPALGGEAGPGQPLRLVGSQRPLDGVGGDLIWGRRHDDGRREVVLADVMGHGALAARVADLIRAILDGQVADSPGPAVRDLNAALIRRLPEIYDDVMFATGLYLDLDPTRGRLRVSNFAHLGMLVSARGSIDPPAGLPVGILPAGDPWPEIELGFDELGGRLMAYTDGIVEQFDPAGAMFGVGGLLREFRATLALDLAASLDRIMARVDRFRGAALVKDDQSLLAIELAA